MLKPSTITHWKCALGLKSITQFARIHIVAASRKYLFHLGIRNFRNNKLTSLNRLKRLLDHFCLLDYCVVRNFAKWIINTEMSEFIFFYRFLYSVSSPYLCLIYFILTLWSYCENHNPVSTERTMEYVTKSFIQIVLAIKYIGSYLTEFLNFPFMPRPKIFLKAEFTVYGE